MLTGDIPGHARRGERAPGLRHRGASYETCVLTAPKEKPLTAAAFDGGDAYRDSPVASRTG